MLLPYTEEDYYSVMHRREANFGARKLGSRTTLQLEKDLEQEFLASSSEEERRAPRPSRHNPQREYYATLAGLNHKLSPGRHGRNDSFVDPYEGMGRHAQPNGHTPSAHAQRSAPRSPVPGPCRHWQDASLPSQPTHAFMQNWRAKRRAQMRRGTVEEFLVVARSELAGSMLGSPPRSPRERHASVGVSLQETVEYNAARSSTQSHKIDGVYTPDPPGSVSLSMFLGYTLVPTHLISPPATPHYLSMSQSNPVSPVGSPEHNNLGYASPALVSPAQLLGAHHGVTQYPGSVRGPEQAAARLPGQTMGQPVTTGGGSWADITPQNGLIGRALYPPSQHRYPAAPRGTLEEQSTATPTFHSATAQLPAATQQLAAPPAQRSLFTPASPALHSLHPVAPAITPYHRPLPTTPTPHPVHTLASPTSQHASARALTAMGQAEGGVRLGQSYESLRAGQEELQRSLQSLMGQVQVERQRLGAIGVA